MHKGVILLVKSTDREEILSEVEKFMEPYGDGNVWDWYRIGGRWNNTLAPKDKLEKFQKKCDEILVKDEEHGFLSQKEVDNKQDLLQKAWEEVGLEGENSYCNHYNLPHEGNIYDIVKLTDCIETVKSWCRDLEREKVDIWEKMVDAKEKADKGEYDMSGYFAGQYKDAQYGSFCFESNVYNISEWKAEKIPDNIDEYYAIMVDMHN